MCKWKVIKKSQVYDPEGLVKAYMDVIEMRARMLRCYTKDFNEAFYEKHLFRTESFDCRNVDR